MSDIRRTIAGWLCPGLAKESDRLFQMRSNLNDKIRWLGHDYPMVEVVLARVLIDDTNYSRSLNEKQTLQEYPHLGGIWPSEIYSFREKMRTTWTPMPTQRSAS